jgi:hypothetical protein
MFEELMLWIAYGAAAARRVCALDCAQLPKIDTSY